MKHRRLIKWIVCVAVSLIVGAGGYLGEQQLVGNFHEVVPKKLYRSAQLSGKNFSAAIRQYDIKSIINLRGSHPGSPWYDDEVAAASKAGIAHIDFKMSSHRLLTKDRVQELITVLQNAPKPILVHCQSGADRSGFVSAVYIAAVEHGDEETAEWQLSPVYGHIPLSFMPAYAMDDTFENFEPLFGYNGS